MVCIDFAAGDNAWDDASDSGSDIFAYVARKIFPNIPADIFSADIQVDEHHDAICGEKAGWGTTNAINYAADREFAGK